MPWISLMYLGLLFCPALFKFGDSVNWLLPTLLSIALFLPLYSLTYLGALRGRMWVGVAVAALGFALYPFNSFSNTYIIYAAGIFGLCEPTRRSVLVTTLMMVGFTAFATNFYTPIIAIVVAWVVGFAVLSSNILLQGHTRKNAVLKLNREEIQQLARAAERERIGRDLHDLLGHSLSVIALKSELAKRLIERDPARAKVEIEAIEIAAREALSETRRAVVGMRAAGIRPELARAKLVLTSAGLEVSIDDQLPAHLPPQVETVLALALRESITNVLRHAAASACEISLSGCASQAQLRVRDNGRGIGQMRGSGLSGMAERVAALGGTLLLSTAASGGTEVRLSVDLDGFNSSINGMTSATS